MQELFDSGSGELVMLLQVFQMAAAIIKDRGTKMLVKLILLQ